MNVCLAHFVVTAEATVDDLQCLFSQTLANIVVVSYHDWKDKDHTVERALEQAVYRLNGGGGPQWHGLWLRPCAIFGKTTRISSVEDGMRIATGFHRFLTVKCQVTLSDLSASGSVTLGVFASAKDAGAYHDGWVQQVCSIIEQQHVRYICGVFWRGKEETETLFKSLRACEDGVFFQPFWTEEIHDRLGATRWPQSRPALELCPRMRGTFPCTPRTWWCVALRRPSASPIFRNNLGGMVSSSFAGAA